jgi:hypothetical protein
MKHSIGTLILIALCFAGTALGQASQPVPAVQSAPNNYGDDKSWLCRPGRHDACDVDQTTTVISADGKLTHENWTANPDALIDCFYVYPTVSTDPTPNSDMVADPAELNVIRQQFARFGSKCRLYAPMYRQITLAGLRRLLGSSSAGAALSHGLQYDDVRDAWNYYLEHDNKGRGFVLIGHSQGSFILAELIRNEIDGRAIQSRMVSAILLGTTLAVPRGKDVGGSFKQVPLCHSESQTGCAITYASFRSTVPPGANSLFGRVTDPNMTAACTNPASLGRGSGPLRPYFSTDGGMITGSTKAMSSVTSGRRIDTPWVSLPGLLTAECKSNSNATYLEVTVHGNPSGPRTEDISGDLMVNGQILADWGLHLVDVNLAMGNLVDLVGKQARAWVNLRAKGKN